MAKNYRKMAEKQIRRSQEATQDYIDGVNDVEVAPGVQAAKKEQKLKNNFNRAVDSGKWRENTAAVSLDAWKKSAAGKGGERFGPGVTAASDDIVAFHEDFGPKRDRAAAEVNAMPDATPEQRKAKAAAMIDKMSALKRSPKRR